MSYDSHCCIVGGGPAGMVLALLLGRAGVQTTILEEHEDFERDFRGDTVHPSTMELMDALGLADRLLELPHAKIHRLVFDAPSGPVVLADFSRLPTKFPYITMMPQARFLDFWPASWRSAVRAADHGRRRPRPALGRSVGPERDGGPPTSPRQARPHPPAAAGVARSWERGRQWLELPSPARGGGAGR